MYTVLANTFVMIDARGHLVPESVVQPRHNSCSVPVVNL